MNLSESSLILLFLGGFDSNAVKGLAKSMEKMVALSVSQRFFLFCFLQIHFIEINFLKKKKWKVRTR